MFTSRARIPSAHLTLRAHRPAPARVELEQVHPFRRWFGTIGWLVSTWGAIPFLLWVPPHYPWVTLAFVGGAYLAYRSWKGRFAVRSFAGICPRCGSALSMGIDRTIDLPHTLTCFTCHFEPRLEVSFTADEAIVPPRLEHHSALCVGRWETRWLADQRFVYCAECHAGRPADRRSRADAEAENEIGELLERLTDEGRPLL
jgi:hypothetical protein